MVVATVGDGAYVFSNPTAFHLGRQGPCLPLLTVVFNNSGYAAVRRTTLSMFRDGAAGQDDGRTLARFDPPLAFHAIARAHGCHAQRVERAEELGAALARARDAVVQERRPALVDVVCPY
jgi:acetolactate synthase-1/2/3 large subunit